MQPLLPVVWVPAVYPAAREIAMDEANKKFTLAGKEYHEGDWLSIDGSTGNIYDGLIPTVDANDRRRVRPHHGHGLTNTEP